MLKGMAELVSDRHQCMFFVDALLSLYLAVGLLLIGPLELDI